MPNIFSDPGRVAADVFTGGLAEAVPGLGSAVGNQALNTFSLGLAPSVMQMLNPGSDPTMPQVQAPNAPQLSPGQVRSTIADVSARTGGGASPQFISNVLQQQNPGVDALPLVSQYYRQ